jgi:hypothetical protein
VVVNRYRECGEEAWRWVLGQVRGDNGPWVPGTGEATPPDDRDSFYAGIAGLAPLLIEIEMYREWTDTERTLAAAIASRLAAATTTEPSLYDGLGGDVTALKLLAPGQEQIPLRRLAEMWTPAGWPTTMDVGAPFLTDVGLGTAGVVLAAAWAGGEAGTEVMAKGAESLMGAAEKTDAGLDWRMYPGYRSSSPNFSHGTAGVASALIIAGRALGRDDYLDAARQGVQHLLAVGSLDDGGFIIPHTLPFSTREVEPVTYTWCHGPTGTSLVFAALADDEMRARCLHSVLTSGLPERLRPGFWDNDGRCCGTAGVGDVLLDAAQDGDDDRLLAAARTMGDALLDRAIHDEDGTRWRFIEYREDPPLLPPGTSWMQGAAGIAAFLLRLARVEQDRSAMVVDRPDQWWAVPARLRRSGVS